MLPKFKVLRWRMCLSNQTMPRFQIFVSSKLLALSGSIRTTSVQKKKKVTLWGRPLWTWALGSLSSCFAVYRTYNILAQYRVQLMDPTDFVFRLVMFYINYCTRYKLILLVELRVEENWRRGITRANNQQWVEEVEEDTIAILQFFRLKVDSFKWVCSNIVNLLWFNQYLAILSKKFTSFGGLGFCLCDLICYYLRIKSLKL